MHLINHSSNLKINKIGSLLSLMETFWDLPRLTEICQDSLRFAKTHWDLSRLTETHRDSWTHWDLYHFKVRLDHTKNTLQSHLWTLSILLPSFLIAKRSLWLRIKFLKGRSAAVVTFFSTYSFWAFFLILCPFYEKFSKPFIKPENRTWNVLLY